MKFFKFARFIGLIGFLSAATEASSRCRDIDYDLNDKMVTHGSPIERFNTRLGGAFATNNASLPSGPAWFAIDNIDFSLHAAIRFVDENVPAIFLHQYESGRQVRVKNCGDAAELDAFLRSDPEIEALMDDDEVDQKQNALLFCSRLARADGSSYQGILLDRDTVRREPELILCHPSQVLRSRNVRFRYDTYIQEAFQCARRGVLLGGRELMQYFALNTEDLSDFIKDEAARTRCE